MTASYSARFFNNFTNGNACSRVVLTDGAAQTITLDASSASRSVTLTAPITIASQQACISSRLASPESNLDFDLSVSAISLGQPR